MPMNSNKTLFICRKCQNVLACSNVIKKTLCICEGELASCEARNECFVKSNPQEFNHYDIVNDGYCDDCYKTVKKPISKLEILGGAV